MPGQRYADPTHETDLLCVKARLLKFVKEIIDLRTTVRTRSNLFLEGGT